MAQIETILSLQVTLKEKVPSYSVLKFNVEICHATNHIDVGAWYYWYVV